MKLINYQHKIGQDFVLATFYGDITKLKPTLSLELSFERLGGEYMPEMSGEHGIIFKFPAFVSAGTLHEIIRNTCFECGGLMKDGIAIQNQILEMPGEKERGGYTPYSDKKKFWHN